MVQNISEINKVAIPIFEQYKIKNVAVFGSFARGEVKKKSDIDFIVSFCEKYDLLDIIGLKQDLEYVTGRKVDILTYASLKDNDFTNIILKEAKLLYEKN